MEASAKRPECGMCTLKCVVIAYKRAPWLRIIREPMLMGMRFFAAIHRIEAEVASYPFPTISCRYCIRFYKTVLLRKSGAFRWLHGRLNPVFNYYMDRIVSPNERKLARQYALAASAGTVSEEESWDWMRGMKTGL
ncbi:MAG: hypothetical protein JXA17_01720 [Dehalococcoidales bacterium]|nr:hypothetical protein [Dehalococcoidales bacterium]